MYWRLFIFFITVSILELLDVFFVSGFFFGLLLSVAGAVAGTILGIRQFASHLRQLNSAMHVDESPAIPFLNLVLIVQAITLLLLPGIISTVLGALLLIPLIRYLVVSHIILRFREYHHAEQRKPKQKQPDIIDI